MKIIDTTEQDIDPAQLMSRPISDIEELRSKVAEILARVYAEGDEAICAFTRKFDAVDFSGTPRVMGYEELTDYVKNSAIPKLTSKQVNAIELAYQNITWFAEKSKPTSWQAQSPDGHIVGEVFMPFNRVACYVPQGSFPLVSTAIHTAGVAKTAGVNEIVMITSPSNGELNPAVAYAAYISGVTEIVFVGGAQGIAALAYGTQTIKKADFICGPGNQYVAEAKRQLYGTVGIDMVAGPSECFIIADFQADPYAVACDLVAQAEHGSGLEGAVLLTDSDELIQRVVLELTKVKELIVDNKGFDNVWQNSLFLLRTVNIQKAIDMTNACAPEHVEVMTENAEADADKVVNAGAVFIGNHSAEPLGDFVAGPSHVLPTGSTARFTSGLTVSSFMRRKSTIKISEHEYEKLATNSVTFSEMEGLIGHGLSSAARLDPLGEFPIER